LVQAGASTYDVPTAAPDLVPLYLARQGGRGPHALRLGEITDRLLMRAGANPQVVPMARRVLIVDANDSAAFATGTAPAPSTSTTRRPVAIGVVSMTHRITRAATARHPAAQVLRNTALALLGLLPPVQRRLAMNLSGLATDPACQRHTAHCRSNATVGLTYQPTTESRGTP